MMCCARISGLLERLSAGMVAHCRRSRWAVPYSSSPWPANRILGRIVDFPKGSCELLFSGLIPSSLRVVGCFFSEQFGSTFQ